MGTSQGKLKLTATAKSVKVIENNVTDNHSAFSLLSCDFHSKMGASFAAVLLSGIMFLVWRKCCSGLWGCHFRWPRWTGRQGNGWTMDKGMDRNSDMNMDLKTDMDGTLTAMIGKGGKGSMQTLGSDELYRQLPVNPYLGSMV